jgi:hypothetical protein
MADSPSPNTDVSTRITDVLAVVMYEGIVLFLWRAAV